MIRYARLAAAVLPLLGLGALWVQSDRTYHQGTEWEVPIQGYDPRDYLRGHYVEFTYDWPGVAEIHTPPTEALCLSGKPPVIERVTEFSGEFACAHPVRAERSSVYGWVGLTRGRLYLGQNRAAKLDVALRNRDQRGLVTIRQREDGSFTPISIRFRQLTSAEIAERDAQDAEAARRFNPPAIMTAP